MNNNSKKAVCFDLDDTIFDHQYGMRRSLEQVVAEYDLPREIFLQAFHTANQYLWQQYESARVTREEVRFGRMAQALKACRREELDAKILTDRYFQRYKENFRLLPGAEEALKRLAQRAKLGIITNGFTDIQRLKLTATGLADIVPLNLISEELGLLKPQTEIFAHALAEMGGSIEQAIFVGDSFETDVLGALRAGWQAIWFNPQRLPLPCAVKCEITADWQDLEYKLEQWINKGA